MDKTSATYFLIGLSFFAVVALAFACAYIWQYFRRYSFLFFVLVMMFWPVITLAQPGASAPDAGVSDPAAAALAAFGMDLNTISNAAGAGKWALLVVAVLALAMKIFFKFVLRLVPDHTAFKRWATSTAGGWVINATFSLLTSLTTYFGTAATITPVGVIGAVLGAGLLMMGGAGANEFAKDTGMFKPTPKPAPPPPPAITTPAAASDALNLPPKDR